MPYPSQTNADSIVAAACEIIERDGVEALSLGKLAAALGVPRRRSIATSRTRPH